MGDKSVETLCNKIEFLSISVTFPPFPPKQCWFSYFFNCTDHRAYTTLNWGAGGIRELTLEANKIEQMLKYRKASFPKSVSTAFVAHCRFNPWMMYLFVSDRPSRTCCWDESLFFLKIFTFILPSLGVYMYCAVVKNTTFPVMGADLSLLRDQTELIDDINDINEINEWSIGN